MKVLFVITDLGKGGAERYLLDLVQQIEVNYPTIEYRIASLFDNVQYDEFKNNPKVIFLNYQTFSFRKKAENNNYSQLLDNFQPDIIHSHRFLAEFITSYDVRASIKYVCHGHDNMVQFEALSIFDVFKKEKVLQMLEYLYLKRKKYRRVNTFFIANSKNTFDFYKSRLPRSQKENVHLIKLGFNYIKFFSPTKTISKSTQVKLINVGSYQLKKNQAFAVEIAKELKSRNIAFELILIGEGAEYDNVSRLISALTLEKSVKQVGLQSNVEEWHKSSHIYLHTATYEPFGLVLLEAMAAGIPVVTLDGQGNRDLIEHGKNGFIFKEADAKIFADQIIKLIEDEALYRNISDNAHEFSKQFSIEEKTRDLVNFYLDITK